MIGGVECKECVCVLRGGIFVDGKTIFFSIVVPIYNVEQFLDDCVRSILEQTY